VGPKTEICDGKDNDCDGQIDENVTNPPSCALQKGVCAGAKARRCVAGKWSPCEALDYKAHSALYEAKESSCDRQDNDCDGLIDEGTVGCVTTYAGSTASCPYDSIYQTYNKCHKDGPAKTATFVNPWQLTQDSAGNLYITDRLNHRIRKIDTNGNVTTYAGDGRCRYNRGSRKYEYCFKNGSRLQAQFKRPQGLVIAPDGTLYIADTDNHQIRKIDKAGNVTTFAGSITAGSNDGKGTTAKFKSPSGLALDSAGNLYIADSGNHLLRKIAPDGTVSTIAGSTSAGFADGVGRNARFNGPYSVSIGPDGRLYVADRGNHRIRVVELSSYEVRTFAGSSSASVKDGKGVAARFSSPTHLFWSTDGRLFVVSSNSTRIRLVDTQANVTTFAGVSPGYTDGPRLQARFSNPSGVFVTSLGELYIADSSNRKIRKVLLQAPLSCSKVGSTTSCYTGPNASKNKGNCKDGIKTCTASGWSLCTKQVQPSAEDCNNKDDDCDGVIDNNLMQGPPCKRSSGFCASARKTRCINGKWQECTIADYQKASSSFKVVELCNLKDDNCNGLIDENAPNCVTTLVGKRYNRSYKDGFGTNALVSYPRGIAVAPDGTLYIADTNNYVIRKVAPDGSVTTFSGSRKQGHVDGDAKTAQFNALADIALAQDGTLVVADGNSIRRIDKTGKVTTLAGSSASGYQDGQGQAALFNRIGGIDVDAHGNVYIADTYNHRIRKVDVAGNVSTIAGSGSSSFQDGVGVQARFDYPEDVVVSPAGVLFVADRRSYRIRKIDKARRVTTFAGSGSRTMRQGSGRSAAFVSPVSMTMDARGNLYVLDDHNIRRITPSGTVSLVSGASGAGYTNGSLASARFYQPQGIAVDSDGNLYVADSQNSWIRKITFKAPQSCSSEGSTQRCYSGNSNTAGVGVCKAGQRVCREGVFSFCLGQVLRREEDCNGQDDDCDGLVDNSIPEKQLCPKQQGVCAGARSSRCAAGKWAVCLDNDYKAHSSDFKAEVCDGKDNDCDGVIDEELTHCVRTIAGTGASSFLDGKAGVSQLSFPSGLGIDGGDNLFIADYNNNRIRKLTPSEILSTLAGSGSRSFKDGPASSARFNRPNDVVVDKAGNLYIADSGNHRIRKVDTQGNVTTLAGNGTASWRDGRGASAYFSTPLSIAIDSAGNLYIADSGNHRIRKISPGGTVSTLAGSSVGFRDGQRTTARFNSPQGITVDSKGNVYVADAKNHVIRKIDSAGNVTTYAGTARSGGYIDGVRTKARFSSPRGVYADSTGNVYVADTNNGRIRKVDVAGNVSTLSGRNFGFKDGLITDAVFNHPYDVVVDSLGNVYVADRSNHRVRKLVLKLSPRCTINGASRSCYSGPVNTSGKGICKQGTQTCSGGLWSSCTGEVLPLAENCNGQDDDCDGQVDNNLKSGPLCAKQDGVCQGATKQQCVSGQWQACSSTEYRRVSSDYHTSESCDGKDNDCNGLVDDTAPNCVTTIVGGTQGSADGKGTKAQFNFPTGIAIDSNGLLVVSDSLNHKLRKIDAKANTTSFVGSGTSGFKDGKGNLAQLYTPWGIVSDGKGNWYFCDRLNHRVRKVDAAGNVTTFAGEGVGGLRDGKGTAARFNNPIDLVFDSSGNLFVVDSGNHAIRKIDAAGNVTTFAGNGLRGDKNAKGSQARFDTPMAIAIDSSDNLYIADSENDEIRKVDKHGDVTDFTRLFSIYKVKKPAGVAIDSQGNVYVAETNRHRIRIVTNNGRSSSLIGPIGGNSGSTNGKFGNARFNNPVGLRLVQDKYLYVADRSNQMIRLVVLK
jgi:sugar lactone lactonase YvrE